MNLTVAVVISYHLKSLKIPYANGRVSVRIFYKNNLIHLFVSIYSRYSRYSRYFVYFFNINFYIQHIKHQLFNYSFLIFNYISHLHIRIEIYFLSQNYSPIITWGDRGQGSTIRERLLSSVQSPLSHFLLYGETGAQTSATWVLWLRSQRSRTHVHVLSHPDRGKNLVQS